MTQHLERLKDVLLEVFSSDEDEDFLEAIEDGIYSCQYETATPLQQWIRCWTVFDQPVPKFDMRYQQGVQFVAEQWDKILSEISVDKCCAEL